MCNCIKEIEERIKRELPIKNDRYKDMKINKVTFEGVAMFAGGYEAYSPVKLECEYTNKKGTKVIKRIKENFSHKYCPFCGQQYGEE
ncbi:hypothetical protein [Clostridium algidicarnis]|uniref:hypothetical protein n=1 Tax=Clostridium algidicarnis TaxID=37659 RepID=UPI003FD87927